jgi:predicted RNA methylase
MLSIGAALMGAASVTGVDVDSAALAVARRNAARFCGGGGRQGGSGSAGDDDDEEEDDEEDGDADGGEALPIDFVRADVAAMSGEPGGGDWGAAAGEETTSSGSEDEEEEEPQEEEEDEDEGEEASTSSSQSSSSSSDEEDRRPRRKRENRTGSVRRRQCGGRAAATAATTATATPPAPLLLGRRGPMVDTVIMNPPFGTRLHGADVRFLRAAVRILRAPWEKDNGDVAEQDDDSSDDDDDASIPPGAVYSLHKASTRAHLLRLALSPPQSGGLGCSSAEVVAELRYDLPATYSFHRSRSVDVAVDLLRLEVPRGKKFARAALQAARAAGGGMAVQGQGPSFEGGRRGGGGRGRAGGGRGGGGRGGGGGGRGRGGRSGGGRR